MLNYPVGSQRTTLSDRNGPSCPSLSDFDYILYLLSADLDFKFRCTLIILPYRMLNYPVGSQPSLSDFDYILDLLSSDFDFKFRCTLILSVLGPYSRPSMSLHPILTFYFDALGPFRTRTLFPPIHVFATDFDFLFRCTRTFPHSDPFPAPSMSCNLEEIISMFSDTFPATSMH